jgi:hypothetical protein
MSAIRFVLMLLVVVTVSLFHANAAYRKPPFNGSIFGKRANSISGEQIDHSHTR